MPSSPDILPLFSDQQRLDGIRALGDHLFLQTPHLDRLCHEGTVFSSAYTPVAKCVPARATMMTGMYADKTCCGSNLDSMPPPETPTLMSRLRDAGYRTHGVGKCHFMTDLWALRGFETRETMEEIVHDPPRGDYQQGLKGMGFDHVLESHGIQGEMYDMPQPSQLPAELHPTQGIGDRCVDFIGGEMEKDRPWYLYAGIIHSHPPFAPPNPWHKLWRAPEMPLPYPSENREERMCFVNRFQNRYKYRDRGLDLNLIRCVRAYDYACVSFIDHQVGRILTVLEAKGVLDHTAGHGEVLGDFGCFGKRSFHDASQQVPMIVRRPDRFQARETCTAPASLVDLLPTFLTAAGEPLPVEADGIDLAVLASGESRGEPVYFHYARGEDAMLGAVEDGWKYAWSAPDARGYLFDRQDPPEAMNRIGECGEAAAAYTRLDTAVRSRAARYPFSPANLTPDGGWRRRTVKQVPEDPDEGRLYQDPPEAQPQLPSPFKLDYPRENMLGL